MYVVLLLIVAFFIDSTVLPVPLVFIFSLLLIRKIMEEGEIKKRKYIGTIAHKSNEIVFLFPLTLSLVLLFLIDVSRMVHAGFSPLIFIMATIGILAYSRFFELSKSSFFVVYLFIFVLIYAMIVRYNIMVTVLVLIAMMVFRLILFSLNKYNEKT